MIIALIFIVLLLTGIPIAFVLGITPVVFLLTKGEIPPLLIPQRMHAGVDTFVLMSIPFFVLAGNLMNAAGITHRLVAFAKVLVGHIRGGLALVNVLVNIIMAGISGSASADSTAVGSILIPSMIEEGYEPEFACSVTASASVIGPIIPPSITMIVYGAVANVSIGALFLGGVIPGLILGLFLMGLIYFYAKKRNYPKEKRATWREALRSFGNAAIALVMPFFIVGGILSGVFTPTEAAASAAFYAFFVGFFIYRELKLSDLPKILFNSGMLTSAILLIIAAGYIFGWVLTFEFIPQKAGEYLLSVSSNPYVILFIVNLFFLFLGTFMEPTVSLIVVVPILLPTLMKMGVDPVHLGVFLTLNLIIGLTTPPVGACLFIVCTIGKVSLEALSKAIFPFIVVSIIVLFLITYFPQLVLFIPHLFIH